MPLYRRLLKRGFKNYNHKDIVAVSLAKIADVFEDGAVIDVQALLDKKVIKNVGDGVKVLSGDKSAFIEAVRGSFSGVVGLPLCTLAQLAKRAGVDLYDSHGAGSARG